MDRKSSCIRVALVLIVAALVANQSVGHCGLFGKSKDNKNEAAVAKPIPALYKYVPAEVYNPEKVNNMIGYTMRDSLGMINGEPRTYENHNIYPTYTPRLVDILAWTKNKDEPNTIVGKFSINQLLNLNYYDPSDCSKDGTLVERRKICDQLDPEQIGLPEDPDVLEMVEGKMYRSHRGEPLEYLRYYNLHRYCTATLEHFEKRCTKKRFASAEASVKTYANTLDKFIGDVEKHIEANEVRNRYDEKQVVQKVLAQAAPAEAEQVKTGCANVVEELDRFFEGKRGDESWEGKSGTSKYYYFCKQVVS